MNTKIEKRLLGTAWALVLALSAAQVPAEISRARAEYLYGPETSRKDACDAAIGKARSRAMANVLGEFVSAEELMSCRGSTGKFSDYGCDLNQITWSQIEGDIRKTIIEKTSIEEREGATACIADVEIDVLVPNQKPDPNFQVRADIGQTVFRVGDTFNVELEFSQPSYFAVFNWLPHENNAVVRVIPAGDDPNQSTVYMNAEKGRSLKATLPMAASWSDAYSGRRKFFDEYLLVVATKRPYKWMSRYSLDDFKAYLQLIPVSEKKLVKKAYQLTKN